MRTWSDLYSCRLEAIERGSLDIWVRVAHVRTCHTCVCRLDGWVGLHGWGFMGLHGACGGLRGRTGLAGAHRACGGLPGVMSNGPISVTRIAALCDRTVVAL